ncbi:Transcription initiation factor TFIID subunit, partial [Operophtera brumata]
MDLQSIREHLRQKHYQSREDFLADVNQIVENSTLYNAWPFLKPVNKKQVKDYYNVIKRPIDMETMGKKIQAHKYHSREEFLRDIQLLVDNCK